MIVELDYGRGKLPVSLPADCEVTVIRKRPLAPIADPSAAVEAALSKPVGGPSLAQAAHGKRSACILICDITRPVPNGLFLGKMVRQLMEAGISPGAITVLVATGLHRPNEGAELAELIGDPWVQENVEVANHFARNASNHVDLGRTPTRGTPVKLDRRFVEADLRIATGLVEPHFMAGWSGGRKVVAPGVAHEDTIRTFHNARFMEDPGATQCNLDGNPLHEEQLAIMEMLGPVHALNTVIDEERRLCLVNFGEIVASHQAAVQFAHQACTVPVARQFGTVVTSAAGYPLDKTYYQTVKGMVTPIDILAPNANLIVAADCREGIGSASYREAQRKLINMGPDAFLASILPQPFAEIDEWQAQMLLKPLRRAQVHLYSTGLSEADRALTAVNVLEPIVESIEEAVRKSVAETGDRHVAVIPEGPYVVPIFSGDEVASA